MVAKLSVTCVYYPLFPVARLVHMVFVGWPVHGTLFHAKLRLSQLSPFSYGGLEGFEPLIVKDNWGAMPSSLGSSSSQVLCWRRSS